MHKICALVRLGLPCLFLLGSLLAACNKTVRSTPLMDAPIAILVFDNQTSEPILGHQVTSLLKEAFLRRGLSVVRRREEATFSLTGTINRFVKTPTVLSREGRVEAYRITIGIAYIFSPQKDGTPLKWSDEAHSDVLIHTGLSNEQAAQDRAIREIAWNLSERAAVAMGTAIKPLSVGRGETESGVTQDKTDGFNGGNNRK